MLFKLHVHFENGESHSPQYQIGLLPSLRCEIAVTAWLTSVRVFDNSWLASYWHEIVMKTHGINLCQPLILESDCMCGHMQCSHTINV